MFHAERKLRNVSLVQSDETDRALPSMALVQFELMGCLETRTRGA